MNFEKVKSRLFGLEGRLLEDEIYRIVWEEIEHNQMDPAAQARSIAESDGDEGKTRSAYIKNRVRRLSDELEVYRRDVTRKSKAAKVNVEPPAKTKTRHISCDLCGDTLGFLRSGPLCGSCKRKLWRTKNLL